MARSRERFRLIRTSGGLAMPRKYRRAAVTLPRSVHRVVARAREYFYWQDHRGTPQAGPRTALPKDPHSPEFWKEIRRLQGDQGQAIATVNVVCDLFLEWQPFRERSPPVPRSNTGTP
jgi:hypothetical protein